MKTINDIEYIDNEEELFNNLVREKEIQRFMIKFHIERKDAEKFVDWAQEAMKYYDRK